MPRVTAVFFSTGTSSRFSPSPTLHPLPLRQGFEELLDKFSGSASLRLDFANFCDVVLNDAARAESLRHSAALLEQGVPRPTNPLQPLPKAGHPKFRGVAWIPGSLRPSNHVRARPVSGL